MIYTIMHHLYNYSYYNCYSPTGSSSLPLQYLNFSRTSADSRFCLPCYKLKKKSCFMSRSSHQRCSIKKSPLKNFPKFTGKHCAKVSFLIIKLQTKACDFIEKETLAVVFSCEFCKNFKSTFFTEHLWTTASVLFLILFLILLFMKVRILSGLLFRFYLNSFI